jgi:serine/threonine-protein kinase
VRADERLGTTFAGYRIEEVIARGGMGVVYRAEHLHLGRTVALKVIVPELAESQGFRQRFVVEARTAAAIRHPNILTVYDAGEAEGLLYLAMQFVPGPDLATLRAQEHPLDPRRVLWLLSQVAGALDAAHGHGLVHRDVKPPNVLVEGEEAYLADFGLAKRGSLHDALTTEGEFLGTVDYAAPEQIRGAQVTKATDVYALGCVLYECLCGIPPFRRETKLATVYAHLTDVPAPLSRYRSHLPEALDEVIAQALAKPPEERYRSCAGLIAAAWEGFGGPGGAPEQTPSKRSAADDHLRSAVTVPLPERTGQSLEPATAAQADPGRASPSWSRRRLTLVVAGVALSLLVGGAALLVSRDDPRPALPEAAKRATSKSRGSARASPPPAVSRPVGVGPRPFGVAVGRGGVWVASYGSDSLRRLDAVTGRSLGGPIPVGDGPFGVAVGAGYVWVTNKRAGTVTRVDPDSGALVGAPTPVGASPTGIAIGDRFAWVTNEGDNTVSRLHPRTGQVVGAPVRVGRRPRGIVTTAGRAWVASRSNGTVTRLSTKRAKVVGKPIRVGRDPHGMAVANGKVWVANYDDGTVSRVSVRRARRTGRPIRVGRKPFGVAADRRYLWIASSGDNSVRRVDLASGDRVGRRVRVGDEPVGVRVGAGAVWVTNNDAGTVVRIEP